MLITSTLYARMRKQQRFVVCFFFLQHRTRILQWCTMIRTPSPLPALNLFWIYNIYIHLKFSAINFILSYKFTCVSKYNIVVSLSPICRGRVTWQRERNHFFSRYFFIQKFSVCRETNQMWIFLFLSFFLSLILRSLSLVHFVYVSNLICDPRSFDWH